jgi:hypothetical protein
MIGQGIISAIQKGDLPPTELPMLDVIESMGHAIILGMVLVLATFWVGRTLDRMAMGNTLTSKDHLKKIIGSMNLMFLTVGLCGIMILINNSIFRAFAIVAAIALVRFRVNLDHKALGSAMIFAILSGMACGVREIGFGYLSVGTYLLLTGILMTTVNFVSGFKLQSDGPILTPVQSPTGMIPPQQLISPPQEVMMMTTAMASDSSTSSPAPMTT